MLSTFGVANVGVTFTKLFSSITESTVWCESAGTRLTWITMLAMADRTGRVFGSIPGLANRARVTVDEARTAIESFMSPDPDSRTKDHEGRRIEVIDGGWRLLNHAKYRALRDDEARKEYKREWIKERRRSESTVDRNGPPYTQADAYTDKSSKPRQRARSTEPRTGKPKDLEKILGEDGSEKLKAILIEAARRDEQS